MDNNTVRVVKIDENALYEYIYENFIKNHESIMGVQPTGLMNDFTIDWENRVFIFAAKNAEDENGNILPFPNDINLKEVLHNLPSTTESMFNLRTKYRDYTYDELRKLQKREEDGRT